MEHYSIRATLKIGEGVRGAATWDNGQGKLELFKVDTHCRWGAGIFLLVKISHKVHS